MPFNPMHDSYKDYFIVMEQTSPQDNKIDIQKVVDTNGLNYLQFSTCLQDFRGYNRNRRLWTSQIVRQMAESAPVQELIQQGSFVGEMGHPVPDSGKVTVERILTIDPDRTSHRITKLFWPKNDELHGIVETLDEGVGSPGYRMMRNILQGINVAFSLRSLVPQQKQADGSIIVVGPGRMVCYDRVYLPSHESAYMDMEIPVKQVISKPEFQVIMESYTDYVTSHSDKIRKITDNMEPAMESATYDNKTGFLGVNTKEGKIFVAPETKYRVEFNDLYNQLGL